MNLGEFLVRLARKSIARTFERKELEVEEIPKEAKAKQGVFVTLREYPSGELRGCIGYGRGAMPLYRGVISAAKGAAFQDPRFPPLKREELDHVTIEVSVLTKPELVEVEDPREYLEKIKVGDGLIIESTFSSGLLLPQVWKEIPKIEDFLNVLCAKAGLPWGSWLDPRIKIYRFKARVYAEEEPRGKIKED
jgi:hypothetical protein